ncbi:alpha-amylase family protein [Methylophilus sp. TWE2]|uniref:alpha-amylase family protein n=1 Tax=Methylophilus sp. TWE2 TaxID=1662285 RepID=UPI0006711FCC|nr:alpha-amylase family protein [Methylophilus sp. TWE2]AKR43695.1 alpha-amylase [Methylophilus sp. TWE2]
MYEQISHSLLNDILTQFKQPKGEDWQHFYTRLGANFYAIHSLFQHLYGQRADFKEQLGKLVNVLAQQYAQRAPHLRAKDLEREKNHDWFMQQKWVGMALYCQGFAGNLANMRDRLPYIQELGVNLVHIMPLCDCPELQNDGGYAVRDFRKVDARNGTMEDLEQLIAAMQQSDMLLTLDVVVNHTSDEHEWALKAKQGDQQYQDYYYMYPDRTLPDMFEAAMPEVFPEQAPGSFTLNPDTGKWVMTVFNHYQWDLNYSNPAVFIEMVDIVLFWANKGVDILRLDAVAFLWKKIGSSCQNEREAHLILQLLKDCCQVTAPGVIFIAEAIVAPTEIIKYFGEDAINAKECEIAYNATFMALLWDAVATKQTVLLTKGVEDLPEKLDRATWLNYVRCHDDIGLGFSDKAIIEAGFDPVSHRRFLVDYYTGRYPESNARGFAFGVNKKTGDARISGALASLAGLETALATQDQSAIENAMMTIILLHNLIMSFGGIPLIYYGDAVGTLNNDSYLQDENKMHDNRWVHRPTLDWEVMALRNEPGTVQQRLFSQIKQLIAIRKEISAFADLNNRELITLENPHLFAFHRFVQTGMHSKVVVVANFDTSPQSVPLQSFRQKGLFKGAVLTELYSGQQIIPESDFLTIPKLTAYWLST